MAQGSKYILMPHAMRNSCGIIHYLTKWAILPSTKIHSWELVRTYENPNVGTQWDPKRQMPRVRRLLYGHSHPTLRVSPHQQKVSDHVGLLWILRNTHIPCIACMRLETHLKLTKMFLSNLYHFYLMVSFIKSQEVCIPSKPLRTASSTEAGEEDGDWQWWVHSCSGRLIVGRTTY